MKSSKGQKNIEDQEHERRSHNIKKGIADVFGEIYGKLYDEKIPEFTMKEMQAAIDRPKRGKSGDSNGIRAEENEGCDEEAKEWIRQIFNEVLLQKKYYYKKTVSQSPGGNFESK